MRGLGIFSLILVGIAALIGVIFLIAGNQLYNEFGQNAMYIGRLGDLALHAAVILLSIGFIVSRKAPAGYASAAYAQPLAGAGAWQGQRPMGRVNPISKGGFLCGMIIPAAIWFVIMCLLAIVFFDGGSRDQEMAMVLSLPTSLLLLCSAIFHLVLLYKIWAAIADGRPRATPGQAVGFLFIPFYNIYWPFQAYWGWTCDYNRYVTQRGIRVPRMSEGLAMTCCIFSLLGIIPFLGLFLSPVTIILFIVFANHAINGVNALSAARIHGPAPDRMRAVDVELLTPGA